MEDKSNTNWAEHLCEGDLVEFTTGQVDIYFSKVAGCCRSIDERDYPKKKYIGRIKDVHNMMKTPLKTIAYSIETHGLICSSIFPCDIISLIDGKERK